MQIRSIDTNNGNCPGNSVYKILVQQFSEHYGSFQLLCIYSGTNENWNSNLFQFHSGWNDSIPLLHWAARKWAPVVLFHIFCDYLLPNQLKCHYSWLEALYVAINFKEKNLKSCTSKLDAFKKKWIWNVMVFLTPSLWWIIFCCILLLVVKK